MMFLLGFIAGIVFGFIGVAFFLVAMLYFVHSSDSLLPKLQERMDKVKRVFKKPTAKFTSPSETWKQKDFVDGLLETDE